MSIQKLTEQMNRWGREKVPFLFVVDFEMKKPVALRLNEIDPEEILFDISGYSNANFVGKSQQNVFIEKSPISLSEYRAKFNKVYSHLNYGDSYLTNLTVRTEIELKQSLRDLFSCCNARYKLYFRNKFLVFSPEAFIQIVDGRIFSYPMKGTIDAKVPGAREIILNDQKELAEHVTIVDLIRNDLSQVADHVKVARFRYVDEIKTNDKRLLQVSSEITGILPQDYSYRLGELVMKLLPAGSVTGAPKPRTVQIIREVENSDRGYYTGVFGYFDGKKLDSGVMIRYIEQEAGKYFYRSGGGITTQSVLEKEHQEIIDKVYVPVD